jgi:hypothetical protein
MRGVKLIRQRLSSALVTGAPAPAEALAMYEAANG